MERNLRFINRFSTHHTNRPETVAEHSFYVVYYSWKIAKDFEKEGTKINFRKLFEKALLHDMEEAYTGDIIRHAKTDEIKRGLRAVSKKVLPKEIYDIWVDSKDDSIEGQIVSFVDLYEVLIYVLEEIKGGNRHIINVFDTRAKILNSPHRIFKKYLDKITKEFNQLK